MADLADSITFEVLDPLDTLTDGSCDLAVISTLLHVSQELCMDVVNDGDIREGEIRDRVWRIRDVLLAANVVQQVASAKLSASERGLLVAGVPALLRRQRAYVDGRQ
jgi:hypothetical protein